MNQEISLIIQNLRRLLYQLVIHIHTAMKQLKNSIEQSKHRKIKRIHMVNQILNKVFQCVLDRVIEIHIPKCASHNGLKISNPYKIQ